VQVYQQLGFFLAYGNFAVSSPKPEDFYRQRGFTVLPPGESLGLEDRCAYRSTSGRIPPSGCSSAGDRGSDDADGELLPGNTGSAVSSWMGSCEHPAVISRTMRPSVAPPPAATYR
jgi:hypothetical protein